MITLLIALIAATAAAPFLVRTLGRPAFGLLALVPAAGFFWLVYHFTAGTFRNGGEILATYPWMPGIHLNIEFRLDAFAGLFGLIILGVGALVLLYCWGYFDSNPRRLSIFAAELTMFAAVIPGMLSKLVRPGISENFHTFVWVPNRMMPTSMANPPKVVTSRACVAARREDALSP